MHSPISKPAPDADIMRIIAASKSVDYSGPVPILQPMNADTIRIIEFVNGVLLYLNSYHWYH